MIEKSHATGNILCLYMLATFNVLNLYEEENWRKGNMEHKIGYSSNRISTITHIQTHTYTHRSIQNKKIST